MNRWRAEYDDGIWRFYRDGMELGLYEKGDVVVDALNVAESRIAELEAERHWIPVSERLPEMNVRVLIASSGYVSTDFLCVKTYPRFRFEGSVYPVTHWMPLPEPPEVQE